MDKTSCLIEVDRIFYVIGNCRILLSGFTNTVYLNREQHRYTHPCQLPSQPDGLRRSPAVSIDNDARLLFFSRRESAVPVGVQQLQDTPTSLFPVVVGKHLGVHDIRIAVSKESGKVHFRMLCVIALYEAPHKPNNDCLAHRLTVLG